MTRTRWLSAALAPILVLALACGGDGRDPLEADTEELEIGGRLTMGGGGRNEAIATYEDGKRASEYLHPVLVQIFNRTKAVIPKYTPEQMPVRMFGLFSGQALVEGSFTIVTGVPRFELTAVFYDYSDDGRLFIGGTLRLQGPEDTRLGPRDIRFREKIIFAGEWAGTAQFEDYQVSIQENGRPLSVFAEPIPSWITLRGHIVYESGGRRVLINPYPVPTLQ